MPQVTAKAKLFRDWEAVIGAYAQNAGQVPGVDELRTELEGLLAKVKDLKIQQETLEAQRREVTQKLENGIEDGREVVRKLRAFAVVRLGSANQLLSQFGVKVRTRKSARKNKTPGTPPPTGGTVSHPQGNSTAAHAQKEENQHA